MLIFNSMNFIDGLSTYFRVVLDATMFIQYFFMSIALVVVSTPKKISKSTIIWSLITFAIIYISFVGFESFFFAAANMNGPAIGGMLFTASFAIIPVVFTSIFTKDDAIHKILKMAVVTASILITEEIGRYLGLAVGKATDITFFIVLARSLPTILLPFIAFVVYKFNISRFKRLPLIHVVLVISIASLLSISAVWQNFLNVDNASGGALFIFISLVELAVLVGLYYSIYSLIDYRHKVTELEVSKSVMEAEKDALEIDIKNREELMKIRHDLQNQLSYTQALLNGGKYEEANKYIQSLINQKEEYLYSFSCPNLVISGIVNLELTKAKIADKKIKFKVVVPPKLPFEDSDLLSLITNIVDNSLENFVATNDKDVINVSIVTQQDYLRILCLNSVEQKDIKGKPSLKTTKNGKAHGYGTKIIKNIAKKYEGYVSFAFEDNKFVCDCMINMNHKGVNNA